MNIRDMEKLYRKTIHLTVKPYQLSNFYNNLIILEDVINIIKTDKTFEKYIDFKCDIDRLSHSINKLKSFFEEFLNLSLCNSITDVQSEINFFNRGLFPSLDKQEKLYIESSQELEVIRNKISQIAITVPKLATKNSIENDSVINTLNRRELKLIKNAGVSIINTIYSRGLLDKNYDYNSNQIVSLIINNKQVGSGFFSDFHKPENLITSKATFRGVREFAITVGFIIPRVTQDTER